ncbi:unnamed protein product [Rhizophagus irregularis]|nr:unnamed protein product [Rhizophagus irregularis]
MVRLDWEIWSEQIKKSPSIRLRTILNTHRIKANSFFLLLIIIQDFVRDLAEMNTIRTTSPEEKSEKEIYNDDIVPFAISDDVEKSPPV